ncbi:16S rRNA (uracil(1498)-N(3))-methyltransferase [Corynebacterium auriscanis]|uniref:16S rRNA (uracil(1498)-N(3))-methyltransferase n=1 Tax=Corynebacterium auriscanis TaxID=99807 RepID=UPI002245FB83|nr:16S rRNA (uracil(1498)-N(3))-methyltransferase [Corynebacterium auriscanis]MCX2163393.1 16S rRNA (uracil(1498)-N(3))-methyltransferase [Corynebacterium auriscanis]
MTDPVFIHPIPIEAAADGSAGFRFALTGAEAKHVDVKRLKDGEPLVITDGQSRAVRAVWRGGQVEVTEGLAVPAPRPTVTVVQAIPKSERAELAVDLMVQAGADRIIPWESARTIAKWAGKENKARLKWENAARSAAKQARRLRVPEVTMPVRSVAQIAELLDDAPTASRQILVLHESASVSVKSCDFTTCDEVVLVVGPEGGVAPEEIDQLESLGARTVVLGPEVLRTASAAAVALGAIGALSPRWAATTD